MEVILREEVPHLGTTGDIVKVKPGYARNYLLPRGLAVAADRRNVKELEHLKRVSAEKRDRERRAAETLAQKLTALRLSIKARAGEEGKLFGSVTNQDIEKALEAAGHPIDRRRIRLAEPIKTLGEHMIPVHLGTGVDAHLTVIVAPEE
jgi:large subunit ribosomal protein L9